MRVSEYIARFLADQGVRHVFMLTGGGAMFLNDAFAFEGRIQPVYGHHEQACAMAAEGYARIAGRPGVVNVTTGPGGINALNGVFGAFTDSVPMLVISGQVKRATHLVTTPVEGLRQLGDQETDIITLARPLCKAAWTLDDPKNVIDVLASAWSLCQSGRPGPVWIDVPIDVQSSNLDEATLAREPVLTAQAQADRVLGVLDDALTQAAQTVLREIAAAQRPVFLWGTGVRLSAQQANLLQLAERLKVPVCTGWTHDTITSDHPLFAGRPGTIGTRVGNFVAQKADLVVVLGSRLNVRQTSYNFDQFAAQAKVIQVDVDEAEMRKPLVTPDIAIHADLVRFAPALLAAAQAPGGELLARREAWLQWIAVRRERYPLVAPHQRSLRGERINPYWFIEKLADNMRDDDMIVTGNASACIIPFQVAKIRGNMRLFSNSGSASMGYDIPAAIGAAFAGGGRRVICLAGDGSAQLNIQELQTIFHYKPNVVVVILENEGYLSIRSSQNNFFKRTAGESPASGVTFPDYEKVARAYGIDAVTISGPGFESQLAEWMKRDGPMLIQARLDGQQGFEPRMSSRQLPDGTIVSPALEDMYPFLDREELRQAME